MQRGIRKPRPDPESPWTFQEAIERLRIVLDECASDYHFTPSEDDEAALDFLSQEENIITGYVMKYYVRPHCSLCGNSGIVDTNGVKTAAGILVGTRQPCLCPNGQAMRKELIRLVKL
jgi:hypothetical protein